MGRGGDVELDIGEAVGGKFFNLTVADDGQGKAGDVAVVDFGGEEPSPRQLLLRAAGYMLSAGTFFLGFLWSQWDEDELTWHDRISRTYLSSADNIVDSEFPGIAHTH